MIEGPADFVARVEAALDLLQAKAPRWYNYALTGLSKIREAPDEVGPGVYVESGIFGITPLDWQDDSVEDSVTWLAAIIVHDACHVHLYRAGQEYSGLVGERACLIIQIEAMETFNPGDSRQFGMYYLLENIENIEYQWWH